MAAYGLAPEKVLFIPHGVVLQQNPLASTARRKVLQYLPLHALHTAREIAEGKSAAYLFTVACPCSREGITCMSQMCHLDVGFIGSVLILTAKAKEGYLAVIRISRRAMSTTI